MARPRLEKSGNTNPSKTKPNARKTEKSDIVGWLTEEDPDDTDIGSWLARRIEGETRQGVRKSDKQNTDPRSAPPYNKFLWASKSKCRALENVVLFESESLHPSFLGPVQVILKSAEDKNLDVENGKQLHSTVTKTAAETPNNTIVKTSTESCRLSKSNSARSVLQHTSTEAKNGTTDETSRTATETGNVSEASITGQEARETEVTRLKRLITIARRHRLETSNPQLLESVIGESKPYPYISVGSAVSDSTVDSGVSLDSLRSKLSDADGIWALEYMNDNAINGFVHDNDEYLNGHTRLHTRRPVKLSYTQREQDKLDGLPPRDDEMNDLCDKTDDGEETSNQNESTPFVTTLNKYRPHDVEFKPQVRALRSAKSSNDRLLAANGKITQDRTKECGYDSSRRFAKGNLRKAVEQGEGRGSTSQPNEDADERDNEDSVKLERINISLPNNSPDLTIPPSIQKYLSPDHPASAIVQKMRQNGMRTNEIGQTEGGSARSSSRASSAVFPIAEMLPSAEAHLAMTLSRSCRDNTFYSEPPLPADAHITGKDLLMHHSNSAIYLGNRLYVVSQTEQKILGPPPFRPQPCRTPLTRARDTALKRICGQSFTQETKDFYCKLMSAKHGGMDLRPNTRSGRQRTNANQVSKGSHVDQTQLEAPSNKTDTCQTHGRHNGDDSGSRKLNKRSVSKESSRSRRPLGQTVSDTEFQEARAKLSSQMTAGSLRLSFTEL